MSSQRIALLVAVAAAVAMGSSGWSAADQGEELPGMTPEMQAEMAAWMKLALPDAHHRHLAPFVGSWKGEVTMWMAPDGPPMVEESLAEVEWILGGRFLEWRTTGDFGGMPYEGRAIEGFNNGEDRYESMWIDNFGTLILYFTGSCSDEGTTREMTTRFADPVAGGTITYRTVYSWTDDDHFTYTAYMDKGDGEFKNMVIRYSRQ